MLTALAIKYPLRGDPIWVIIFGWIHGVAWLGFVTATITAAILFRWPIWAPLLGVLLSVLPFLTIPFDIWMERTGRLGRRKARDSGR